MQDTSFAGLVFHMNENWTTEGNSSWPINVVKTAETLFTRKSVSCVRHLWLSAVCSYQVQGHSIWLFMEDLI
jgi:hypothetical protein